MSYDISDHPDLQDADWTKRYKRLQRRQYWRRTRLRYAIGLAIVVVVAAVVGYVVVRKPAPTVQSSSDSAATTTPVTMHTGVRVDLRQPFVATPAAGWSDGEAGLIVPPGTAMNGFPAAKTTQALAAARTAIATGYLDRRVVQDGNAEPFVALFAPDARKAIQGDPRYHLRIKSGFPLLEVPPKVNGTLTIVPGKAGELVVTARYAVAYAFFTSKPDDLYDEMDIVSVVRVDGQYIYREGKNFTRGGWGLWPGDRQSSFYSMSCKAAAEGFLAPAYSDRLPPVDVAPVKDEKEMFDPNAPLPTDSSCPK